MLKLGTELTDEPASDWFCQVRLMARTLDCLDAFTNDQPDPQAEKQAYFILSMNLQMGLFHVTDACTTAKALYDHLQKDYAGKTFVRKAELLQRIIRELPPANESLEAYMSRAMRLRSDCRNGGVDDDEFFTANFLNAMRDTEQFHDSCILPTIPGPILHSQYLIWPDLSTVLQQTSLQGLLT